MQTDRVQRFIWYINDTDTTVKIPVGEWVNIKADVDANAGKANVTISKKDGAVLYTGEIAINGAGKLYGLHVLRGRGVGTVSIDSITVKKAEQQEEITLAVVSAKTEGTAYPDKDSIVTVTFTGDKPLDSYTVMINDKAAAENVSYTLDLSADTEYSAIKTEANQYSSAYYKLVGTKLYMLTSIKTDKLHCDALNGYGWWNGANSQIYMTIDGKEYSVGSHVWYNADAKEIFSNAVLWSMEGHTADANLINAAADKVTRSYMALGSFDDDTDTDKGCILLNEVDLSLAGYTADTLSGKNISFCGFIGPNDGTGRFASVDAASVYTLR